MPWGNQPGKRIPEATRQAVLRRDHGICCECGKPGANRVDHRIPRSAGGTDSLHNLAAIHDRPCHLLKTQREAATARWRHRRQRTPEQHPGMR